MGLIDSIYSDFRPSENIEDRRGPNGGTSPDRTPELKNVPDSLHSIAVALGNYLWGTPMLPEAPNSPLGDALGKRDIQIVPQINSRSPLDRAIDTATDEISMFRRPGEKLGSDTPFTQRSFPNFTPQSFAPMGLASSQAAPQDNARVAFDYYVSQGLSPVQAAGIVGNLQGESGQGLNPNAVNRGDGRDGSDSVGIGQWNSDRAQALRDFAAAKGTPWNDLNTQLEFLHQELRGPERGAYDRLMAAKTPEEAGQAMLAFERPKDWNKPGAHPERGQYAARVFASYGDGQPQPAPATSAAPPSAPLSLAPPQAPIFPQQPQQPQPDQGGGLFDQTPQMQTPPIFFAQRRSPDLSRLRAAFKPPVFNRG